MLVAGGASDRGIAVSGYRFPHAPRLDPLRAALGKFEAAPEPAPQPQAPPPPKVDKRARR